MRSRKGAALLHLSANSDVWVVVIRYSSPSMRISMVPAVLNHSSLQALCPQALR